MLESLKQIEDLIFEINGHKIKNLTKDQECKDYFGVSFQMEEFNIKFRKAKITDKKTGMFVTLWKRNIEKQTEPYHVNDDFDFYIIVAEQENKTGFFMFPKYILSQNQILTNHQKEGKRGFRVYPAWTKTENKQAEKTQIWQTMYFIDLAENKNTIIEKLNLIIQSVKQING